MFCLTEAANRKLSWNTIAAARRSSSTSVCRRSIPPILTAP
jgi:hypothetical protein